ncbi:MAG: pyridoxal phosphate-dependent aminotransferase [Elusimicrobiaceae bacterium]|nr:pyridoxal phosphate-dependent aminotransferase [Elusimicrobiaceae bacterium]
MNRISELAKAIISSPTLALDAKAKQMKAAGEPVIHLGGGEPAGEMPPAAKSAALEKINSGLVKYTAVGGTPSLKKAVADYTLRAYGHEANPENILISGGAKQSLYNFLFAVLDPGDEVVFAAPYWVSYPEMVRMCRAVPVIVTPADGGFEPAVSEMDSALTPRTKAVLLNSPNNPSGHAYSPEFVRGVIELCQARGIFLVMDDIYRELVFDAVPPVSAFKYAKNPAQLVIVNGISKTYGMTGFRIGWAVADPGLVRVMANIQGQTTSCPSDLSQAAAIGALEGGPEFVAQLNAGLKHKRDILVEELAHIKGVRLRVPKGTFYSLPDFSFYNTNSVELAQFLLEKAKVVTIPGAHSGMEGHLRISYCGPENGIIEGIRRIRWALDPGSPSDITIGGSKYTRTW